MCYLDLGVSHVLAIASILVFLLSQCLMTEIVLVQAAHPWRSGPVRAAGAGRPSESLSRVRSIRSRSLVCSMMLVGLVQWTYNNSVGWK